MTHIRMIFGGIHERILKKDMKLKDELSRKKITRSIGNGFDVCMKYRVGLGWKNMEKWEKIHILGIFW